MALRDILRADIFRVATLHLGFRSHGMEWSGASIKAAASALRALVERAPSEANNTDQETMAAVDSVMRLFYPSHQRWDDPHLHALLKEHAELLDSCSSEDAVPADVLQRAFRFGVELWIALAALESRSHRNGRH